MNTPHPDDSETLTSGFSLLRPAVSPRAVEESRAAGVIAGPLGPFSAGAREAAPVPEPAPQASVPEPDPEQTDYTLQPDADDDLPWITRGALWEDAPDAPAAESALGGDSLPDLPLVGYESESITAEAEASWLEFDSQLDEPAAARAPEPEAPLLAPESDLLLGDDLIAPPEWEYGYDSAPLPEPASPEIAATPAAPVAEAAAEVALPRRLVLEDVAARLERIARSLRGSSPTDLLADADDPLQVLIAGYALGLADAARAASEPSRERS